MIKVRFAPSPTGTLHVGGARTALFNYLFAKNKKGKFILRIEDTDIERSDEKHTKNIMDGLEWLGLNWDEGPYKQRERLEIYEKYIKKLLKEDKAYYCFCTKEELDAERNEQMANKLAPKYSGKCSKLSKEEVAGFKAAGKPSVIKFRVESKKVKFTDLIRGDVEFDSSLFGDITIAKDERTPLYNFAVVVDDYEMGLTHVLRGEDHISNTPKQILIYEALGLPIPKYGHIAMILGSDKSKLSKRHGATSITDYKEMGYLPEALVNFIALLGWNPGTEQEIFSKEELMEQFSLEKMTKSGAVFNIEKLDWINGCYIRQKNIKELSDLCVPYLISSGLISKNNGKYNLVETEGDISEAKIQEIIKLEQERIKKLSEIGELTAFFFKNKLDYPKDLLRWKNMSDDDLKNALSTIKNLMSEIDENNFKKETIEKSLFKESEKTKDKGRLFWPLRALLSGKKASPGPCEIAEILGKKKTLERIEDALQK
jgi:glutamyl-tRNA synthetase